MDKYRPQFPNFSSAKEFEEAQEMCSIPVEATYTFGSDGEYDNG